MASFAAVVAVIAGLMVTPASAAGGVSATFSKSSDRGNGYEGDYTPKNVGYFVQWGVYGRNYHVKNIETSGSASKLTHINYAFGNVTNGSCTANDDRHVNPRPSTTACLIASVPPKCMPSCS